MASMIDWLRGDAADPHVIVAGRRLPLAIRRHAGARRLTMRLAPDGSELRVTLPTWCATREALAFASARIDWIGTQLARVPAPQVLAPGCAIPFRDGALTLDWRPDAPRRPKCEGETLVIGGPQARIGPRVQSWLETEAMQLFASDLTHYCAAAGEALPNLRLSRARRRWGSCSGLRDGGRTVALNWRLVMAPDAVRRSVVAHEVAHLAHFDHSPAFHRHLAFLYDGDLAAADLWLKREGPSLYRLFA